MGVVRLSRSCCEHEIACIDLTVYEWIWLNDIFALVISFGIAWLYTYNEQKQGRGYFVGANTTHII